MADLHAPLPTDRTDLARALFEQSADALFLLDPKADRLLDANPAAQRLTGLHRDDLLRLSAADLFRPASADGTRPLVHALDPADPYQPGPNDFLLRTRAEGVWVPISLTVTRLDVAPWPLGLIIARDRREQRVMLEALRASQVRLEQVLEATAEGIVFVDRGGLVRMANPEAARILGEDRATLIGRLWAEAVAAWTHLDGRPVAPDERSHERVLRDGDKMTGASRMRTRPDGSHVVIRSNSVSLRDAAGRVAGMVVSFRDVTEQFESTEALRRSEERFRTLVEKSSDAISLVAADGTLLYATPSLERIIGRPVEEVVGQTGFARLHPEDQPVAVGLLARCLAEPDLDVPFRLRASHTDGSWRHVEGVARNRLADPVVRAIVVNYRDVTERARAEEALRASERRYRDLVEHAPIAIWEKDFTAVGDWMDDLRRAGVRDLRAFLADHPDAVGEAVERIRVVDVNSTALMQNAAATKQDLVDGLAALYTDESRETFIGELAALWEGRADIEFESHGRRLDGRRLDLLVGVHVPRGDDGHADLRRVVVTAADITERRRAEKELAGQHALLQAVLDSIPDLIVRKDTAGVYQACNPAFQEFFSRPGASVADLTDADLFPPEPAAALETADRRVLAGGPSERLEVWLPAPDGRRILFETLRVALTGPDGRPAGLIGISRDITARRQLEDQLRQAGKMEAVGQLAGGVAHDFNNLLTAVLGHMALVEELLPADHPARELLASAEQAAWRAAELTRQLLGFARRTTLTLEPTDPTACITETVALLRRAIDPRIAIEVHTDPNPGLVLADAGQITQVLMNLCLNARDAMPEGGTLTLSASDAAVSAAHVGRHPGARAGAFVRLSVADTGSGIPPEVREHLFEPFFTTKGPGQGTGLGLAMVHGIVQQHRGWVEVESAAGRGSCFDVYLPRSDRPSSIARSAPPPAAPARGTETILLADDEPMVRYVAQMALEQQGYRVLVAADGREAVDRYQNEGGQIDLVILDLTMPRLSGHDACRELVRLNPAVRVLLSSGYAAEAVEPSAEPGVRGFVAKPYRPGDLTAAVRAALDAK